MTSCAVEFPNVGERRGDKAMHGARDSGFTLIGVTFALLVSAIIIAAIEHEIARAGVARRELEQAIDRAEAERLRLERAIERSCEAQAGKACATR